MIINFTQYVMPHGFKKPLTIDRPSEIGVLAEAITMLKTHRFECEVLRTGEVSFTCFDIEAEEDIMIVVCPNGISVPPAVDKMIRESYRLLFGDLKTGVILLAEEEP